MSRKTRTKRNRTEASTGASTQQASAELPSPRLGWHEIRSFPVDENDEGVLADYLMLRNYAVQRAGGRHQRYDLEIVHTSWVTPGTYEERPIPMITSGRYEVKSLPRRKKVTHAWDRRFKAGSRGHYIYGRRDAEVKAFALDLEELIGDGTFPVSTFKQPGMSITEVHDLIDACLQGRHSKKLMAQLTLLAEVYEDDYGVMSATRLLRGRVGPTDILGAFSDLDGIFVVAGAYFTLIAKDEIPDFLIVDSASVEGVKLKYVGHIET